MHRKFIKRVVSGSIATLMMVTLNINPLLTIGTALVESGVISEAGVIGSNIIKIATGTPKQTLAATPATLDDILNSMNGQADYTDVLYDIMHGVYSGNSQRDSTNSHLTTIQGYDRQILTTSQSIDSTTKAILADTDYIKQQLGYDPNISSVKPKNVKESFERVSDQLDQLSHEYRVANIKSLNNEFSGALWKPKYEDVENLTAYCEITGGFANTYDGYWNTSIDTVTTSTLPTDKALETLGYDAILRAEGIVPLGLKLDIGTVETDKSSITLIAPYADVTGGSGDNTASEVVVLDELGNLDVVYNDWGQITDSYNVSSNIPTSQVMKLMQITIPADNVTYLDAVTVLYKALGQDVTTLEGFYTRNPEIEVESSPLAKQLAGVVDNWEGYDYYVFATRSNPISYEAEGDNAVINYDYAYWRKAVNGGLVNYELRDEPISAIDFCTLAMKMMVAYGEPEINDDEIQTLLQTYGSYYPIQLGENLADAWAYLKARGIITDDNFPTNYEGGLARGQLLDMCARIKDRDLRETYKSINLAITLDDLVVDDGVYPYYDMKVDTTGMNYVTTTINYDNMANWTYLFPMTTDVNLGYGGVGIVYADEDLSMTVSGASYNGMIKLHDTSGGHYYYVVNIPKNYSGNAYLAFTDIDDPDKVIGNVKAVEFNPSCMYGGIFTQYVVTGEDDDRIATLADAEDGVNWFSFASMPNAMDLIWFADKVRSDQEPVEQEVVSRISGPIEYIEAAWNKLTEPSVALAAEDNSAAASIKWTITQDREQQAYNVSDSDDNNIDTSKYLKSSTTFTTGGSKYVYTQDDEVERVIGSAALTAIARAATITDYKIKFGSGNQSFSAVKTYCMTGQVSGSTIPVSTSKGFAGVDFYALYALAANGVPDNTTSTPVGTRDKAAVSSLIQDTNTETDRLMEREFEKLFSTTSRLKVGKLGADGTFTMSGSSTDIEGFKSLFATLVSEVDAKGGYTSIGESALENELLDHTLTTSVLMNRDQQVYVSWSDLTSYGIAYSTEADGMPDISGTDDIYEFYTKNGVVRVDNINHIIQVGTQVFAFTGEEPPTLVIADSDNNELYFDSRCITGVSNNKGYTLDAGKATTTERDIGAGKNAIVCLTPTTSYADGTMKTQEVNGYSFGDLTSVNTAIPGDASQPLDIVKYTLYDKDESPNGFIYWPDEAKENSTRVSLSSTMPTANWIMVISDEDQELKGRLYVFYLRQAFDTGFANDNGTSLSKPSTPSSFLQEYWSEVESEATSRISTTWPNINFNQSFEDCYAEVENGIWKDMTRAALASLTADTGVFWSSPVYYCRMFDLTNQAASSAILDTSLTSDGEALDESNANEPGSIYFLDYLGFIYNMPKCEDFNLQDYYDGVYPLPLAISNANSVVNYNMNYYGHDNQGRDVPLGFDLTSDGFVHYTMTNNRSAKALYSASDYSAKNSNQTVIDPPFDKSEFTAAPAGVYARYGLFNNLKYDTDISKISQTNTKINNYYIGTRRVAMSDTGSTDGNVRYWTYGGTNYQPIAIPSTTSAMMVSKYTSTNSFKSVYILQTNAIISTDLTATGNIITLGLMTEDITWEGKGTLLNILNQIDKTTNWWMWLCFTLAPMICLIIMTILIGISFITDNKIWLGFCEKFFDPVRLLTLGARDSNTWHWQKVLIPCLITYIAFALFCNANILKIIIWAVDSWTKLLSHI